jgi:hypothetical protein
MCWLWGLRDTWAQESGHKAIQDEAGSLSVPGFLVMKWLVCRALESNCGIVNGGLLTPQSPDNTGKPKSCGQMLAVLELCLGDTVSAKVRCVWAPWKGDPTWWEPSRPIAERYFWRSHNSASLEEDLTSQRYVYRDGMFWWVCLWPSDHWMVEFLAIEEWIALSPWDLVKPGPALER